MTFPNLDFFGSRHTYTKVTDDLSMDFTDDVGISMVNLRDSVRTTQRFMISKTSILILNIFSAERFPTSQDD